MALMRWSPRDACFPGGGVTALQPVFLMRDDRDPYERFRAGDASAFETLFREYYPRLVTFATHVSPMVSGSKGPYRLLVQQGGTLGIPASPWYQDQAGDGLDVEIGLLDQHARRC